MKKRIIAFTILLCLVFLSVPARADGVTEISDAAGLRAIADYPAGAYVLTGDIDLSDGDWMPIPFSGTLDGQGYSIYNLRIRQTGADTGVTYDGNRKRYDTEFAALFSVTDHAEISNLNIVDADVSIDGSTHTFAAILAGRADHTNITGCTVSGRVYLYSHSVMAGVSGLIGFGSGTVTDCTASVELVFEDRSEGVRCEQFMGGVLASGIANIYGTTVHIAGYDSCHGYVHNGGMVGMNYEFGLSFRGGLFENCTVDGFIRFFEDNPDRRAYCKALAGETLTDIGISNCTRDGFVRDETYDYDTVLSPELCDEPEYTEDVTEYTCTSWGHTTHTCALCGYTWRDTYTHPAHRSGGEVTVLEPTYDAPGRAEERCIACGELLSERELPALERPPEPHEINEEPEQDSGYTFGEWLIIIFLFGWIWYK